MSVHTTASGGSSGTSLWTTLDDGTDVTATLENTRNSATTQDAIVEAKVGGTAGGKPIFRLTVPGGKIWNATVDNPGSDEYELLDGSISVVRHSALGTILYGAGGNANMSLEVRPASGANSLVQARTDNAGGLAAFMLNVVSSPKARFQHFGGSAGVTIFGILADQYTALFTEQGVASNGLMIGTRDPDPFILAANDVEVMRMSAAAHATMARRLQTKMGANVASASTLTLGADGNVFPITGTATINHVTVADWQAGSPFDLLFSTSLTVTHNAGAPPGGTVPILIDGAANFSATANDILRCVYDGTVVRAQRIVI